SRFAATMKEVDVPIERVGAGDVLRFGEVAAEVLWPPPHQRDTSEIWFLNHPTAMLRRSEVMNLGGYPTYRVAQDLGLWLKVVKAGLKIHNLPTVELYYRLHPRQVSRANGVRREEYAQIVEEW